MSSHDDLGRTLRDRADTMGDGHPLSLDDVKGRARGIRRRRYAATGLAAAAVLAVAIPAGVVVANNTSSSEVPPADQRRSETPEPTERATTTVTLDNEVDATSGEPLIDYLLDGALVSSDEGTTSIQVPEGDPADRRYDTLVHAAGSWLALWRDEQGRSFVDFIERGGNVVDTARATDTLAVSRDGSQAVYGTPSGGLVSWSATDQKVPVGDAASRPPNVDPVAVNGDDGTCREDQPGGGGCVIHYNAGTVDTGGYYVTSHGIGNLVAKMLSIGGVSPDGLLDGVVSTDGQGSCSAMLDTALKEMWRTCDYRLGKFSPDGRYVLGHSALGDGLGDSNIAILHARTGTVLVDYVNDEVAQAFVGTAVWETDSTVLATVFARGHWSLMRMTPGGELSVVEGMKALGSDEVEAPLVLATQP